jgi:hypothetical protein
MGALTGDIRLAIRRLPEVRMTAWLLRDLGYGIRSLR